MAGTEHGFAGATVPRVGRVAGARVMAGREFADNKGVGVV